MPARDHWVVISDDDLRLIEDGPEELEGDVTPEEYLDSLEEWIEDVQNAILAGLETA